MEQLTPGEWAKEQLRRAPSFAVATGIVALLLLLSTFIEYSAARPKPRRINPLEAEIAKEEPPPIEEIKDRIDPKRPELDPMKPAPVVDDREVVPVDAPLDDMTLDVDLTENVDSDAPEASDPFPMELTKKMAVIGTASGTGGFRGVLGNRTEAGKRRAASLFGMPKGTDKDILAALRWLAKVQNKETGGWDDPNYVNRSAVNADSGLALLAFLGYGCTDKTSDKNTAEFAPVVKKAIEYLINAQVRDGDKSAKGKDGSFGEQFYTQGICTMALCEAYAMDIRIPKLKEAAQAGIDFILRHQPSYGSFGYTGAGNDTSVTGFQIQAMKAAYVAGLDLPESAREKTERWLKINMTSDGGTPYRIQTDKEVQENPKPTMTAASLTARLFMGHKRNAPDCIRQAEFITRNDAHVQVGQKADNLYHVYYLCLSMFNMGDKYWKSWNAAFNEPLRAKQEKDGPEKGSWPEKTCHYGNRGGRVYTTAMACLALEVYFRFLPSYKDF